MIGLLSLIPGSRLVQGLVVAAVVAAAVGAIGYGVHSYKEGLRDEGRKEVRAEWDAAEALRTDAALKASEAARVKENSLNQANARIRRDLVKERIGRAADAVAAAGRVRDFQAALEQSASTSPSDTASRPGVDATITRIAGECAVALGKMDERAKHFRGIAKALQDYTGSVCLSP